MEGREDRRDRTVRHGENARRVHLSWVHPDGAVDCACERSSWFFAKRKSLGCDCRRRKPGGSPKVANGMCYDSVRGYHPCVAERIAGKKLCRAWAAKLRGAEAVDVEL